MYITRLLDACGRVAKRRCGRAHAARQVCISTRVPVVRALGLTWALPLTLLRRAAIELWTWSDYLELRKKIKA
ncbi:unnamed protein product [Ectocarpus sp. 12 AP-2014]